MHSGTIAAAEEIQLLLPEDAPVLEPGRGRVALGLALLLLAIPALGLRRRGDRARL